MKRLQLLGVALAAVCAFGVFMVASASAAVVFLLAEWLVGGSPVVGEPEVDVEGELLLENTKGGPFGEAVKVLCSGILDGTIGANGTDLITKVLNLGGEEVGESLVGLALSCTGQAVCETEIEVWPDNLPWLTTMELMEEEGLVWFVDLIAEDGKGNPGWHILCKGLFGVTGEDLCTSPEGVEHLENEPGGVVDALFEEAFTELAGLKLRLCMKNNEETGIVEGLGTILLTLGGTQTVSSE